MIALIRWLLVPVAIYVGYVASLAIGYGLFMIGGSLCPPDQISSGMCAAPWFGHYMKVIMAITPSITAALTVGGSAAVAPSHKRVVALVTLALGSGLAVVLATRQLFILPSVLSILVGSITTSFVWRRDTRANPEPVPALMRIMGIGTLAFALGVFTLVLAASMIVSSLKIQPLGPKFGRGPVTVQDVPRLMEAVKKRDNTVEAIAALGRAGPAAAPAVPLLLTLQDDENENVAYVVLGALERIGPDAKDAIPSLRRCVLQDRCGRWDLIRKSAQALAGIGDADAIVEAGKFTDDHRRENGIADAVRNHEINAPGLDAVLERLFRDGSTDYVRESAAIGLARISPKSEGLVDFFSAKLEKEVQQYAQMKSDGAKLYNSHRIDEMRKALERIGSPEARAVLDRFGPPQQLRTKIR